VAHPATPSPLLGSPTRPPAHARPAVSGFPDAAPPADSKMLIDALADCDLFRSFGDKIADATFQSCTDGTTALGAYLDAHAAAHGGATSAYALARARLALVCFLAWQGEAYLWTHDTVKSFEARDAGMADVFQRLRDLDYPNAKIVMWAHNVHLEYASPEATGPQLQYVTPWVEGAQYYIGATLMGTRLAQAIGPSYVAIGLTANQIAIDWPGLGCSVWSSGGAVGSVEAELHRLGKGALFVDLAVMSPLFKTDQAYGFADVYLAPAHQFRALVYLDNSPATTPVGRAPCAKY